MKKFVTGLLVAAALPLMPMALAPAAHAEVCGDVGGRHVDVGGCSHVGADIAAGAAVAGVAGADDAAAQAAMGRPPCFTPAGIPYYTPGDLPC